MKLTIDQARELRDALQQAILNAANDGSTAIDLQPVLSARAREALEELQAQIEAVKRGDIG